MRKVLILFLSCALALFCGCNLSTEYSDEFFAMDTVMTVTAYGDKAEEAVKAAEAEINRLDGVLSVENENSEIYILNSQKEISASEDTLALLESAGELNALTDGAFDITSQSLSQLWGFYSGLENKVPSQSEIDKTLTKVGAENIKITGNTVTLESGASVDLGGIAKGYASAKTAQILKDKGVTSALISLGGNIRAVGSKPDGADWIVAITDPDDNSGQVGVLSVSDTAVVTSGGYQRYFEENGQVYHHIIDTKTGYPAQSGLKSVTVASEDDTLADGLSTALFVMGLEKSGELYSESGGVFGAVFVTDENKIYITDNLDGKFSSQRGFEVIKA